MELAAHPTAALTCMDAHLKHIGKDVISFVKKYLYIYYLFLAVLGLSCCTGTSSSCAEQGLLSSAVRLLRAAASLVAERRLYALGLQ